jgi:hypothetical protein
VWCGNAGWFPGLPALLRVAIALDIRPSFAGIVLASAAYLATLYVVWIAFLGGRWSARNGACLGVAGAWFGQVYYHAGFPIILTVLIILISIRLLLDRRYIAAGLIAAAATTMYSTAVLIAPAMAIWLLLERRAAWRARLKRTAIVCIPSLIVYGLVMALIWAFTGTWHAYADIQKKYVGYIHNPFIVWWDAIQPFAHHGWRHGANAPSFQALSVGVIMGILGTMGPFVWRRIDDLDRLLVPAAVLFWIVPLMAGRGVSIWRGDAMMLPTALIARRLPVPVQLVVVAAELVAAYGTTMLFLQGRLI